MYIGTDLAVVCVCVCVLVLLNIKPIISREFCRCVRRTVPPSVPESASWLKEETCEASSSVA
jgi:hypothetical protein